jgi:hypothetical protein
MRCYLLLIAFGFLTGCVNNVEPECFERREPQDLNPIEQIVLSDAKARTEEECSKPNRQCNLRLKRDNERKFLVFVVYATRQSDGTCIFLPGDDEMHVYGTNGSYIERFPGM